MNEIRKALRDHGIRIDPSYRLECERLADNPGIRMNYFRADGLTIDGISEMLWDEGFTHERIDCNGVLELLERELLTRVAGRKRSTSKRSGVKMGRRRKSPPKSKLERDLERARKNRSRKYQCRICSQITRGTRETNVICGRCYDETGEIRRLELVDLLPEEVEQKMLESAFEEMESAA